LLPGLEIAERDAVIVLIQQARTEKRSLGQLARRTWNSRQRFQRVPCFDDRATTRATPPA